MEKVDVATTIIGLARYSDDYTRSAGPSMVFAKDINNHADHINYTRVKVKKGNAVDPAPTDDFVVVDIIRNFNLGFVTRKEALHGQQLQFSCAIPLHHIFGFCRNVRKVIYGAKHTIALVRKGHDNDAIWRTGSTNGKVVFLSKIVLWMQVMTPSITAEERLLSFMEAGGKRVISWLTTTTDVKEDNVNGVFTWHLAAI